MKYFQTRHTPLAAAMGLSAALLITPTVEAAGLLTPKSSSYSTLTIQQHHVDVVIEEGYATTTVEQVFHNPNPTDLEAIYSFPVPDKAAVGEFSYWIDGQPVTGEVVEKQRARQIYEAEKQAGREAAIVEKERYKTFDISVFPVRANQDVRIKLVYLQNTQTDSGIGRYVYPLEEGGVDEQALSFWSRNEAVEQDFSFNVKLRSGYLVDGIRLPQHPNAKVAQISQHEWHVALGNQNTAVDSASAERTEIEQDAGLPNQIAANLSEDILLYWRQTPDQPASLDMQAYRTEGDTQGTFMLTLSPGDDLPSITAGRDWVFVLDISGSMQGKFSSLVEGIRQGLGQLSGQDRFKIVLFNNQATEFTQGFVPADTASIERVLQRLDQVSPSSGTNLYAGLNTGIQGLDSDRSNAIVLVTDGVANVGTTEKSRFLSLLEKHDVRLFTFVMGNSANRPLLEEMTRVSNGFAMSISNADDIVGQLMLAKNKMSHEALRDLELEIEGGRVKDIVMPRLSKTLYRGQQLSVFGHYYQSGDVKVTLKGKVGDELKTYSTRIHLPAQHTEAPELERLWAFAAIENMQAQMDYLGESSDTQQAITDTAVAYGLVTDYTSMIVLRDEIFKAQGIDRTNQQRVATEQKARELRAQQPVIAAPHRADSQQPMFQGNRANASPSRSGSGGGAISPVYGLVALCLIGILALRRRGDEV